MELKSVKDILLSHRQNPEIAQRPAIKFENRQWTYSEYIDECMAWASALQKLHSPEKEFNIGVLLDNGPDYCLALGATALLGARLVGINPTRKGDELTRDITHTDCELILTQNHYRDLLSHIDFLPVFSVDSNSPENNSPENNSPENSSPENNSPENNSPEKKPGTENNPPISPDFLEAEIDISQPYLLLFTSGTTGDPKAAVCSQQRLVRIGKVMIETHKFTKEDVCYQVMPMFHSNALMAAWIPCLLAGACGAFRGRFSASNWLSDIQKFGATYFNYVGKPLTYILSVPETPGDKEHKLSRVFGNEGAAHDLERFSQRFGVPIYDSYGSTEGGLGISRTEDTPVGALGKYDDATKILDSETGRECPLGEFDSTGKLLNPEEAIGEMAHLKSHTVFEGYWKNAEADLERVHDGIYWSGDLGYKDADGFIYFAGRNYDWLRVDGENFAAAPVERILVRHPDIDLAAVYAVPNSDVGDDVMAAVVKKPGAVFESDDFLHFLKSQKDMGTKWMPRYIRWADDLPKTETMKILKRTLVSQRWECDGEVWVLDGEHYRLLTKQDRARIAEEFAKRGRESELR